MSEVEAPVQGSSSVQHLRCTPGHEAQFQPLWDARNVAIEAEDAAEIARLTAEMLPHQTLLADSQAPVGGVHGSYIMQHLRCTPGHEAQFQPLWDARNVAIEAEDAEAIARLTAEMLPHQTMLAEDTFPNIVTDAGSRDLLDKYFKGAAYTQTMRMGLKGVGVAVVGDTQASHASWLEQGLANAPTYTGNRPSQTFNAATGAGAGARSSATPTQVFAITSTGTVSGCFINNGGSATKDDTTGILFSAGDFTGGTRGVINGDSLNSTYTLTL